MYFVFEVLCPELSCWFVLDNSRHGVTSSADFNSSLPAATKQSALASEEKARECARELGKDNEHALVGLRQAGQHLIQHDAWLLQRATQ